MSEVSWPEIVAHRERLVRIARRRCPTREDAEDVVHEAMLRCVTYEQLDPERIGAFLTSVTIRLCADLYRDAERSRRAAGKLDLRATPDPENEALRAAEAGVLGDLLSALPPTQRAVIVDRASGMSLPQISSRHALTYKAVESALSRARSTLRVGLASALSTLAAGAAAFRRRPVAVAALPVATLAVVGTVVSGPFGGSTRPRAETVIGAGRAPITFVPEAHLLDPRPAVVSHRAPAPVHLAVRRAAPVVVARPDHDPIVDVGDTDTARAKVDDNRKQEPVPDTVARCVNEGVWISGGISPDGVSVKQGCGDTAPPGAGG